MTNWNHVVIVAPPIRHECCQICSILKARYFDVDTNGHCPSVLCCWIWQRAGAWIFFCRRWGAHWVKSTHGPCDKTIQSPAILVMHANEKSALYWTENATKIVVRARWQMRFSQIWMMKSKIACENLSCLLLFGIEESEQEPVLNRELWNEMGGRSFFVIRSIFLSSIERKTQINIPLCFIKLRDFVFPIPRVKVRGLDCQQMSDAAFFSCEKQDNSVRCVVLEWWNNMNWNLHSSQNFSRDMSESENKRRSEHQIVDTAFSSHGWATIWYDALCSNGETAIQFSWCEIHRVWMWYVKQKCHDELEFGKKHCFTRFSATCSERQWSVWRVEGTLSKRKTVLCIVSMKVNVSSERHCWIDNEKKALQFSQQLWTVDHWLFCFSRTSDCLHKHDSIKQHQQEHCWLECMQKSGICQQTEHTKLFCSTPKHSGAMISWWWVRLQIADFLVWHGCFILNVDVMRPWTCTETEGVHVCVARLCQVEIRGTLLHARQANLFWVQNCFAWSCDLWRVHSNAQEIVSTTKSKSVARSIEAMCTFGQHGDNIALTFLSFCAPRVKLNTNYFVSTKNQKVWPEAANLVRILLIVVWKQFVPELLFTFSLSFCVQGRHFLRLLVAARGMPEVGWLALINVRSKAWFGGLGNENHACGRSLHVVVVGICLFLFSSGQNQSLAHFCLTGQIATTAMSIVSRTITRLLNAWSLLHASKLQASAATEHGCAIFLIFMTMTACHANCLPCSCVRACAMNVTVSSSTSHEMTLSIQTSPTDQQVFSPSRLFSWFFRIHCCDDWWALGWYWFVFQQHVFLSPILKLHCIWSGIHGNLRDLDRFPPQQRPFAFCCALCRATNREFLSNICHLNVHTFHLSVSRRIFCSFGLCMFQIKTWSVARPLRGVSWSKGCASQKLKKEGWKAPFPDFRHKTNVTTSASTCWEWMWNRWGAVVCWDHASWSGQFPRADSRVAQLETNGQKEPRWTISCNQGKWCRRCWEVGSSCESAQVRQWATPQPFFVVCLCLDAQHKHSQNFDQQRGQWWLLQ